VRSGNVTVRLPSQHYREVVALLHGLHDGGVSSTRLHRSSTVYQWWLGNHKLVNETELNDRRVVILTCLLRLVGEAGGPVTPLSRVPIPPWIPPTSTVEVAPPFCLEYGFLIDV
jgi:hypothetical protein